MQWIRLMKQCLSMLYSFILNTQLIYQIAIIKALNINWIAIIIHLQREFLIGKIILKNE